MRPQEAKKAEFVRDYRKRYEFESDSLRNNKMIITDLFVLGFWSIMEK